MQTFFMRRAIELAEKGRYKTAPNPCVGAVLVHKDTIIAEGYHMEYGKAHAEVECLANAVKKGIFFQKIKNRSLSFSNPYLQEQVLQFQHIEYEKEINMEECSLYVTLEPCNHFGKTPPCSQAIFEAGIKTVYVGCSDLNANASGGADFLRSKGVNVVTGVCHDECLELIEDFIVWQKEKRSFCILKMACTLDGKIGPATGHSHSVSGSESKRVTMKMRKNMALSHSAVMVGGNTFFEDNPKLTVRDMQTERQPRAFIVSKRLPPLSGGKTGYFCLDQKKDTVFFTDMKNPELVKQYAEHGILLECIETSENKSLNLKKIFELAYQKYYSPYVFSEGGAKLAQSLLKEGLVDILIVYIAPYVLGDDTAKNVFSGNFVQTMQEAYKFKIFKTERIGSDLHVYLKMEKTCSQG